MAQAPDPLLIQLTKSYVEEGLKLFEFYVDQMFPAVGASGARLPVLNEELDDEQEEWLQLEEIWKRWRAWQAGELEEDSDILRFDANEDGAQQRLQELRLKFTDGAEGGF